MAGYKIHYWKQFFSILKSMVNWLLASKWSQSSLIPLHSRTFVYNLFLLSGVYLILSFSLIFWHFSILYAFGWVLLYSLGWVRSGHIQCRTQFWEIFFIFCNSYLLSYFTYLFVQLPKRFPQCCLSILALFIDPIIYLISKSSF